MRSEEKIYTCEVKRLFIRDGNKVWDWKIVNVADAIRDGDSVVRCKDCHGTVRVHGRHVAHGPAPHVEHLSRQDRSIVPRVCIFGRFLAVSLVCRPNRLNETFRTHPGVCVDEDLE